MQATQHTHHKNATQVPSPLMTFGQCHMQIITVW